MPIFKKRAGHGIIRISTYKQGMTFIDFPIETTGECASSQRELLCHSEKYSEGSRGQVQRYSSRDRTPGRKN